MAKESTISDDLKTVLSLSQDEFEKIVNLFTDSYKTDRMSWRSLLEKKLRKDLDMSSENAKVITRTITGISKICTSKEKTELFLNEVTKSIDDNLKHELLKRIQHLEEKNVIRDINYSFTIYELQTFALPHLTNIEFMPDFRLAKDIKGNYESIPVIICNMSFHHHEKEEVNTTNVVFQMIEEQIDEIMDHLQKLKKHVVDEKSVIKTTSKDVS